MVWDVVRSSRFHKGNAMNQSLIEDTIDDAIGHLRSVLRSKECGYMSKSNIVGYLGELLVRKMLESEGCKVIHLGNQRGVDLEYQSPKGKIRIDVKTSMRKKEFLKKREDFVHWGWAMREKAKGRSPSHFVCLGLDATYGVEDIFVLQTPSLGLIEIKDGEGLGQFNGVSHGLLLPCSDAFDIGPDGGQRGALHMEKCRELLRNRTVLRKQRDEHLSALLESHT
jgi:hypothetical protein